MLGKISKSGRFWSRVVIGGELLDPIEVFYLPGEQTVYPINSKAGCSTVKLLLIRRYAPGVTLTFPSIHHTDPSPLTRGAVRRIFFIRVADYAAFCRDKDVVLITRDPLARIYSCYQNIRAGSNTLYATFPALRKLLGFTSPGRFTDFVDRCCRVPDWLADRHFRSQAYYLPEVVRTGSGTCCTIDIAAFSVAADPSDQNKATTRLNVSTHSLPNDYRQLLLDHPAFRARYRQDLTWYSEAEAAAGEKAAHPPPP